VAKGLEEVYCGPYGSSTCLKIFDSKSSLPYFTFVYFATDQSMKEKQVTEYGCGPRRKWTKDLTDCKVEGNDTICICAKSLCNASIRSVGITFRLMIIAWTML